jgi:hypothetical protein
MRFKPFQKIQASAQTEISGAEMIYYDNFEMDFG